MLSDFIDAIRKAISLASYDSALRCGGAVFV